MAKAKGSKGFGNEAANESGEAYLHGRRAGVEETYGMKGKRLPGGHGRVAEITVPAHKMDQADSGSLQEDLTSAAHTMYQDAVKNAGDKYGDKALTKR